MFVPSYETTLLNWPCELTTCSITLATVYFCSYFKLKIHAFTIEQTVRATIIYDQLRMENCGWCYTCPIKNITAERTYFCLGALRPGLCSVPSCAVPRKKKKNGRVCNMKSSIQLCHVTVPCRACRAKDLSSCDQPWICGTYTDTLNSKHLKKHLWIFIT